LRRLGYSLETYSQFNQGFVVNKNQETDGGNCQVDSSSSAIKAGLQNLYFFEASGQIDEDSLREFNQVSTELLNSTNAMCAFKLKYSESLINSTKLLSKLAKTKTNSYGQPIGPAHYGFPNSSGGPFAKLPRKWQQSNQGLFYTPINGVSASEGLFDLYQNPFQTECAAGLQLSELYSLWFLYRYDIDGEAQGDALFDKAYTGSQMAIGTWDGVARSLNPFRTMVLNNINEAQDPTGARFAKLGRHGLTGVTGYIGKKKWELALNSPSDRGENFIVVNMSNAAAADIAKNGVETLNYYAHRAWQKFGRKFKFGLVQPNPRAAKAYLSQYPVFNEVTVYVHPLGLLTLGDHIARLIGVNPATPYNFQFYSNRINYEIYNQYVEFHYQDCLNNI
jgi:hypothetical protein